jgi:hypothetical protein
MEKAQLIHNNVAISLKIKFIWSILAGHPIFAHGNNK